MYKVQISLVRLFYVSSSFAYWYHLVNGITLGLTAYPKLKNSTHRVFFCVVFIVLHTPCAYICALNNTEIHWKQKWKVLVKPNLLKDFQPWTKYLFLIKAVTSNSQRNLVSYEILNVVLVTLKYVLFKNCTYT
jgi:hypothetical protein